MSFEHEFSRFLDEPENQALITAKIRQRTGYNQQTIDLGVTFSRGRINLRHPVYTLDHTERGIDGIPGAFFSKKDGTAFKKTASGVRRLWHVPVADGIPHQEIAHRFAQYQAGELARQLLKEKHNV